MSSRATNGRWKRQSPVLRGARKHWYRGVTALAVAVVLGCVANNTSNLNSQLTSTDSSIKRLEQSLAKTTARQFAPAQTATIDAAAVELLIHRAERMRARMQKEDTIATGSIPGVVSVTNVASIADLVGNGREGQVLMTRNGKPEWVTIASIETTPEQPTSRHAPYDPSGGAPRSYGGGSVTVVESVRNHSHTGDSKGGRLDINNATLNILSQGRGGTGFDSFGTGDLLVGNANGGLSKLTIGSAGYVLTSSGGTTQWLSPGAVAAAGGWIDDGSVVRLNTISDSVGIGTVAPLVKLQVSGSGSFTGTNARVAIGKTNATTALDVVGTISGSLLYVAGTLSASGTINQHTAGSVSINQQGDSGSAGLTMKSYRNSAFTHAYIEGLGARGSAASPAIIQAGDSLLSLRSGGWDGSDFYNSGGDNSAVIDLSADENFTSSLNHAGKIVFSTLGSGDNFKQARMTIKGNGFVGIGTTTPTVRFQVAGSGSFSATNSRVAIGKAAATTALDVVGSISGSTLTINGSITNTGSLTTRGAVTFRSLTGCTALQTDSNGILSCGNPAGTFGSGNVLTIGDSRYLKTSRGTMTGVLAVRAMMSGSRLSISGNANITGSLLVRGTTTTRGTISGALITQNGAGSNYFMGNLGIGTATPKAKLDVVGTISGSALSISRNANITGSLLVNGNVGIGTTTPLQKLDVAGNIALNTGNYIYLNSGTDSNWRFGKNTTTNDIEVIGAGSASRSFIVYGGVTNLFNVNLATGRVGVGLLTGATDPAYKLTVEDSSKAGTTVASNVIASLMVNGAGRDVSLRFDDKTSAATISMLSGDLYLNPKSGTSALVVKSTTGNVGIGTTTPGSRLAVSGSTVIGNYIGSRAAKAQLDVIGTISGATLNISGGANITGSLLVRGNITTRGNFSGSLITQNGAGTNYMMGNLGIGKTNVGSYAAQFTRASSQYLIVSDNASISLGADTEFWWSGWVNFDSVATDQILVSKASSLGGSNEEVRLMYNSGIGKFQLTVGNGTSFASVNSDASLGTITPGTWYFVLAWHDAVNDTVNIKVNNTTTSSSAWTGGTQDLSSSVGIGGGSWTGGRYFDGRLDSLSFGKSPSAGIANVIGDVSNRLYNNGKGLLFADLNNAQKTNWGLISWWDFEEGNDQQRLDRYGTNHLSSQGPTQTTGIQGNTSLGAIGRVTAASFSALGSGASVFFGNVGLGVSNPASRLAVSGSVIISNRGNLAYTTAKTALEVLGTISGATLNISGGANITGSLLVRGNITTRGTISGALITQNGAGSNYFMGNVGIGTASPGTNLTAGGSPKILDVIGTVRANRISDTVGQGAFLFGDPTGRFDYWSMRMTDNSSAFDLSFDKSYGGTYSSVMFLQRSTGNVGIGTSLPGARLSVSGSTVIGNNIGSRAAKAQLDVVGTISGSRLSISGNANITGALLVRGNVSTLGTHTTRYGLQFLSGALLNGLSGFNNSVNLPTAHIATRSVVRLTSEGNLTNIGSIQAGEAHFRTGGTFLPKTDYTTGTQPFSVAIGDLNGDGKADLAAVNYGSATASVFRNTGNGTFAAKVDYATGAGPTSVVMGDLNGDGKADLVTVNNNTNSISVLMNTGSGTLAAKVDYATGSEPYSVALGDLNGDGKADLAVTNGVSFSVSVFLNNGNGTFAAKVDYATGTTPRGVVIGDLNGDGKADLAVANAGSTSVSVFLNNGNGTFAAKVDYTTGTVATAVALGDLNGDGKADLVVTNGGDLSVSVFLNTGNGTFAAKVDYTTGTQPFSVAIGDLNGDGKADLAAANYGSATASVFLNNGNGTFAAKVDYGTGTNPYSVAIGDLNGDGKADLAVTNYGSTSVSVFLNNSRTILFASATGTGYVGIGSGSGLTAKATIFTEDSFNQAALAIKSKETTSTQNLFTITTDYSTANNLVYRITASGSTFADGAYNTGGADYAEWFPSDPRSQIGAGEVVCLDPTQTNMVKRCDREADPNIIGIRSVNPSVVGNAVAGKVLDGLGLPVPGYTLVGLIGQLESTATTIGSGGVIKPGDPLTSSVTPGVLRKAQPGESTVGVALTGLASGVGEVRVLIARTNTSNLTDKIDAAVSEHVANLKVDDKIKASLETVLSNSAFDERIAQTVHEQMAAIQPLTDRVSTLEQTISALNSKLASLSGATIHSSKDAGQVMGESLTLTGSLAANTLSSEETLSVGRDARIGGDLYLEGALIMTGNVQFSGSVQTGRLTAASGSQIDGTLSVAGDLLLGRNFTLGSGSVLSASDLVVRNSLVVLGPITINGLATFLGDVDVHGELIVSGRQAGTAMVPAGQKVVTVTFGEGGFQATPVVNATPNDFMNTPWRVAHTTSTGFIIEVQEPSPVLLNFSWLALGTRDNITASGTTVEQVESSSSIGTTFPLDERGVPVSSDAFWNSCIRHQQPVDSDGNPVSCARFGGENHEWEHPDLHIRFGWNDEREPPALIVPDGYMPTVMGSSSSSSSIEADSSSSVSSVDSSSSSSEAASSSSSIEVVPESSSSSSSSESEPLFMLTQ